MNDELNRQEIEKDVLCSVLIKSLKIPRFDTLQEYLRQRAGISDEEFQEIRYQVGAMASQERVQYVRWKQHMAERKKELFKSFLPELLVSDVNEDDIRLWIDMGELNDEEVEEARKKVGKIENNKD
ncbi:hypothetical protein NM897_09230 [Planococcus maritimus]|uniref:hypothetical protein n=1 Tax=Planococcus maritimus TaxID=192421 RepID=UPI0031390C94